jgi:predicted MFS family arabinose efflux permease
MAVGSVAGTLLAASRERPRFRLLLASAAIFGIGCSLAAISPNYGFMAVALVVLGVSTQTFMTSSNSLVQLSTAPAMRGRVLAILLAIVLGGTPVGAPVVGWVADRFGPRWALACGAASGFSAAIVGLGYLMIIGHVRVSLAGGRLAIGFHDLDSEGDHDSRPADRQEAVAENVAERNGIG